MPSSAQSPLASTPASGPGLIYASSHITNPDLTPTVFNKWYNEHHINDILATNCVSHAARWECADKDPATAVDQYLATYRVPDLQSLQGAEFASIPMTHELLPGGSKAGQGGRTCHESVDFDTGIYELVEVFEKEKHDQGKSSPVWFGLATPCIQFAFLVTIVLMPF